MQCVRASSPVAAVTGAGLTLSQKSQIIGDVASNDKISIGPLAGITGNAEAVSTISGNVTGTSSPGSAPKALPDTAAIMQYYRSVATDIPFQSTLENVLLSPTSNPFGATNPNGVYRIQCSGGSITISNCRIVGTLILENCGGMASITNGINWQPARPDYPALIVNQQGLNFYQNSDLNETALNTDFSLPTEPGYGSIADVYPNRINGLVYIDGYVYINDLSHLVGTIITTDFCWLQNDALIDWDPAVLDNPPVGF